MNDPIPNGYCLCVITICIFFQVSLSAQCPSGPSGGCDGSGNSLELYWVGTDANNNGDWSAPCSWRVGSVSGVEPCQAPRPHDNVFFNAAGFSGGAPATITINSQARCNNLTVNPDISGLGSAPTFALSNPGFLEIYGSLSLEPNIVWNTVEGYYNGSEIFFKATTAGHTIKCAGHTLGSVQFDGIGGEWSLQDHFRAGCVLIAFGYLNTSDGSSSHDMTMHTFDSDVRTGGDSTNRRWDLNSSIIHVTGNSGFDRYGYNTTNAPACTWECRGTSEAQFKFNAGNSKIQFEYSAGFVFVRLGGLKYNHIHHMGTNQLFYDHYGPTPCYIDTLELDGANLNYHSRKIGVLKINSSGLTHDWYRADTITTDLIMTTDHCSPTTFRSDNARTLYMPASVSADPMVGMNILGLNCDDGTAGHAITGFNSLNATGWNVTAPASRDLYWTGATDTDWDDPTNWATDSAGTSPLLVTDCGPSQVDNVYFVPAANGQTCDITSTGYCNDMIWSVTGATSFNDGGGVHIYGDLQLDADMTGSWVFTCYGSNSNTIKSDGKDIIALYLRQNADYTLLDSLSVGVFLVYTGSSFTSNGFNIGIQNLYGQYYSCDFDISGSKVWMSHSRPIHYYGSQWTFDTNTHLYFTGTGDIETRLTVGIDNIFPQFTLVNPTARLRTDALSKGADVTFHGDVTLNGSARFYGDDNSSVTSIGALDKVRVYGDLNLAAGETYEFGLNDSLIVTGNLSVNGNCSTMVSFTGVNGSTYKTKIDGSVAGDYMIVSGSESVNAHTITNSADLGGNTNWTFSPVSGQKYYWRALNGSGGATFTGNWNASGYWTTSPGNTEGDLGCIPSSGDTVVFDNQSFSGSASNITIGAQISCAHIEVASSNVAIVGSETLIVLGGVASDGSATFSGFTGTMLFGSQGSASIDFGGASLGCDVKFVGSTGNYSLAGNFTTTKELTLQSGSFNTANYALTCSRFNSSNTNTRTLSLGTSIFTITDNGTFNSIGHLSNVYVWDTEITNNLMFNATSATINFSGNSVPVINSGGLNFGYVNFTNVATSDNDAPVWEGGADHFIYLNFEGSGKIYGSNSYDTLEFTPGNIYRLEEGSIQTFTAPDGVLIATGTDGNEIAIKSTSTGTVATFHKSNSGSSMTSFCLDYVSVEDNQATSDDSQFRFFTGINSNDISASGIWDFSRGNYVTPDISAGPDQYICVGTSTDVTWNFNGSGPYYLAYSIDGAASVYDTILHGTTSHTINVSPIADMEFKITSFSSDNCNSNVNGVIAAADTIHQVLLPSANVISQSGDSSTCNLANEGSFIHFHAGNNGSERPILSIADDPAGVGLGSVTVTTQVDNTVQRINGDPYLERRFGFTPTNDELALVRLYFTQDDLDTLSAAHGSTLNLSDLKVTKFANDAMDFSGGGVLLTPTSSGSIPAGITTTSNVHYLEISVSSFSHFVIHGPTFWANTPLPIDLLSFDVELVGDEVEIVWTSASETNCSGYDIEKSSDGRLWQVVGSKSGKGNASTTSRYKMLDPNPMLGRSYYRLVQIDFDGAKRIYNPLPVNYNGFQYFSIYPNPSKGEFTVESNSEWNSQMKFEVYNSSGAKIMSRLLLHGSVNKTQLQLENYPPGVYLLKIFDQSLGETVHQRNLIITN